jgi:ADP-ribose pyrophosphatase YjhB (NUDIX family)
MRSLWQRIWRQLPALPLLLRIWRELPVPLRMAYLRLRYGRYGIGVAALIHDEHGRVLLVHRTYSREEPWALPGGWLESRDVTVEHALERELFEETGLRVHAGLVRAVDRAGFALVVLLETHLLDPVQAFRPSPEISEIAWVDPRDVGRLSPTNARLMRRALNCLG